MKKRRKNKQKKQFIINSIARPAEETSKVDLAQEIIVLKEAVQTIQKQESLKTSLEELYRICSNVVSSNSSKDLYIEIEKLIVIFIKGRVRELRRQTSDPHKFLELVFSMWEKFSKTQRLIADVFTVLDRSYVCHTQSKSIWDFGVATLRRELDDCPEVENKLHKFLVEMIRYERNGLDIPDIVGPLCDMLLQTSTYFKFEDYLKKESENFFQEEAKRSVQNLSISDYLSHVSQRLKKEKERCNTLFHSNSDKKMVQIVLHEMIIGCHKQLLGQGLHELLDKRDLESVQRLYQLCKLTDLVQRMRGSFRDWAKQKGFSMMKIHPDLIPKLLKFQSFLDQVLQGPLESDTEFKNFEERVWGEIMNKIKDEPSATLAAYIDKRLREGPGMAPDTFRDEMNRCVRLFQYVNGQDVFTTWYSRFLAKRLLLKKSASEYEEKAMIGRLKRVCGEEVSKKLDKMFSDIELSKSIIKEFRGTCPLINKDMKWDCQVLDANIWPTNQETYSLKVPDLVREEISAFDQWYTGTKHDGRKLRWVHSFSHCAILAHFDNGSKELVVSAHQGVVLLSFLKKHTLSYKELLEMTGLSDALLTETITSLLRPHRILKKKSQGYKVTKADKFRMNKEFKHNKSRLKLNSIQIKITEKERSSTSQQIQKDRKNELQAAIVRIMKFRKELKHNELMSEVFKSVRFDTDAKSVKEQIQNLLVKDYIERDPDDSTIYHYKA